MYLDHQAIFNHVFRELVNRHHFGSTVNARGRPLNNERTASVVATRRTHRIHEGLVVRHQDFGFVLVIIVGSRRLVRTCEKQVFVVVLEAACNLRPEILLADIDDILVGIVQLAFEPAVIPIFAVGSVSANTGETPADNETMEKGAVTAAVRKMLLSINNPYLNNPH